MENLNPRESDFGFESMLEESSQENIEKEIVWILSELKKYLNPPYNFKEVPPEADRQKWNESDKEHHNIGRAGERTAIIGTIDLAINNPNLPFTEEERTALSKNNNAIKDLPNNGFLNQAQLDSIKSAVEKSVEIIGDALYKNYPKTHKQAA